MPPSVAALPLGLPQRTDRDDSAALIEYGAFLFQSPLLSRDRSVACTSCHDPALDFSGLAPLGIGINGQLGKRHPPPLVNLYAATHFMLDGRMASLEAQLRIPIEAPSEMAVDWPAVLARLATLPQTSTALSFTGEAAPREDLVVKSLAAYVRSLVTGDSPFDRYYFGGAATAISAQAKEGLLLFVRKGRCSGCHLITGTAAPLADGSFHSIGIGFEAGAYRDVGRSAVTGQDSDRGAFKTPTLRNVAERRYFMHDGSMRSLKEVIDYYNHGGNREAPNLDGRIRPLFLTAREREAIIAFLRTLSAPVQSYRPGP